MTIALLLITVVQPEPAIKCPSLTMMLSTSKAGMWPHDRYSVNVTYKTQQQKN
jgi:hypothetical protein